MVFIIKIIIKYHKKIGSYKTLLKVLWCSIIIYETILI